MISGQTYDGMCKIYNFPMPPDIDYTDHEEIAKFGESSDLEEVVRNGDVDGPLTIAGGY